MKGCKVRRNKLDCRIYKREKQEKKREEKLFSGTTL